MRLLLINPNTSVHITERMAVSARMALLPGDTLDTVTATEGPSVVRDADTLAKADAGVAALAASRAADHDAIVLAISLDGAVDGLRRQHPSMPVVGMLEAGLMTACLRVRHVGLLTLGAGLLPLYRHRVEAIGLASRVIAYEAPDVPRAFASSGNAVEPAVLDVLVRAGSALREAGAQAVVLAGAVLCGYAATLSDRLGMPCYDGVACAVQQVRVLLSQADA